MTDKIDYIEAHDHLIESTRAIQLSRGSIERALKSLDHSTDDEPDPTLETITVIDDILGGVQNVTITIALGMLSVDQSGDEERGEDE